MPNCRRFLAKWNWWPVFIINIVLTLINLVAFTGFGIYYNIKVRPSNITAHAQPTPEDGMLSSLEIPVSMNWR